MLDVVRKHPEFRRVWLAQVASQGGDWFSRIAVLTVIGSLTDASQAVATVGLLYAAELALRLVPSTLLGSVAGPVADRFSRRALMVVADVVRAALVLGLLLVDEPEELPLLYVLVALQMGTGVFFETARSAATPSTLPREELHAAYALTAATWSVMLTVGSLTGGVLVDLVGVRGVFVIDALTYLLSAALLIGLKLPAREGEPEPVRWRGLLLFQGVRRGLRHVRDSGVLPAVLAKTFWGPAGGYLVILSLAANERFGAVESVGFATGILFAARGLGTGLGPVLARRYLGGEDSRLRLQVALGFACGAVGYALVPLTQSLWVAAAVITISHIGGATIWVGSTTLWQKHIDDGFRGRVYALELFGMTAFAFGGVSTGIVYDLTSLDTAIWWTSASVAVGGLAWILFARGYRWHQPVSSAGLPSEGLPSEGLASEGSASG